MAKATAQIRAAKHPRSSAFIHVLPLKNPCTSKNTSQDLLAQNAKHIHPSPQFLSLAHWHISTLAH